MNPHLGLYLWKEWRDQRAGLARLGAVLVLLAAAALLLPVKFVDDPLFLTAFLGVATAAFTFSVGADLSAGEVARGRVRFLERMPAGLAGAFVGKAVFFVLSALASAAAGLALGIGVAFVRCGHAPSWSSSDALLGALVVCAAVLPWTFASSTWLPRSALALPVAVLLLVAFSWPVWLLHRVAPWYAPAPGEVELYALLFMIGAPLVAATSFVLGLRHGGGPGRAAVVGLGVATIALAPAWIRTGFSVRDLTTLDPRAEGLHIGSAILGADARTLFATVGDSRDWSRRRLDGRDFTAPEFAVIVDVATGEWRAEAHAGFPGGFGHGEDGQRLDARTAAPLAGEVPKFFDHGLPRASELGLPEGTAVLTRCGLGYQVTGGYFDPFRGRFFERGSLFFDGERLWRIRVRDGEWAAFQSRDERGYVLFDPDTRTTRPIPGLREDESVCEIAPDGRLIVVGDGAAALLDPETATRTELAYDDGLTSDIQSLFSSHIDPALLLVVGDGWNGLVKLDAERGLLRRARGASGYVWPIGGPDPDAPYVVEDYSRVLRVRFGSDEREVLFPPGAR